MDYTVIISGKSYDLPKKTMKVMEEMDRVAQIDNVKGMSLREKFKSLFDFITNLVGVKNSLEILCSDKLYEVDLSEVTLTFKKIMDAYDKPLADYNTSKSFETFDKIPLDKLSKIVSLADKMK